MENGKNGKSSETTSGTPLFNKTNINNKSPPIFSPFKRESQKWIFRQKKFQKTEIPVKIGKVSKYIGKPGIKNGKRYNRIFVPS